MILILRFREMINVRRILSLSFLEHSDYVSETECLWMHFSELFRSVEWILDIFHFASSSFYFQDDVLSVSRASLGAQLYLTGRAIGFVTAFDPQQPLFC